MRILAGGRPTGSCTELVGYLPLSITSSVVHSAPWPKATELSHSRFIDCFYRVHLSQSDSVDLSCRSQMTSSQDSWLLTEDGEIPDELTPDLSPRNTAIVVPKFTNSKDLLCGHTLSLGSKPTHARKASSNVLQSPPVHTSNFTGSSTLNPTIQIGALGVFVCLIGFNTTHYAADSASHCHKQSL